MIKMNAFSSHGNQDDQYECEISFQGEADLHRLYATCSKNPGHKNFIPARDFNKEHLPTEFATDDVADLINILAELSTRIVTSHISKDRPEKWPRKNTHYPFHHINDIPGCVRTGTGAVDFVQKAFAPVHGMCPCHECKASDNPQEIWWKVRVTTATHVVHDTSEAKSSVVECFFDSKDDRQATVKKLYGLHSSNNPGKVRDDWCVLTCATHDGKLGEKLIDLIAMRNQTLKRGFTNSSDNDKNYVVVISHPHGCPKMITVGSFKSVIIPAGKEDEINNSTPFKGKTTCRLPAHSTSLRGSLLSSSRNVVRNMHCNIDVTSWSMAGNGIQLVPGAEFEVPEGTSFSLPKNAPFARLITSQGTGYTFPPKTQFNLSDGREFHLPTETKFYGPCFDDILGFLSYNTETCPGSSGACVLFLGSLPSRSRPVCQIFTHSCTMATGYKKSALGFL